MDEFDEAAPVKLPCGHEWPNNEAFCNAQASLDAFGGELYDLDCPTCYQAQPSATVKAAVREGIRLGLTDEQIAASMMAKDPATKRALGRFVTAGDFVAVIRQGLARPS